jgi:outer membrane receptor protein involved in Fe transport
VAWAQSQYQVSGTVVDKAGDAVPYANVALYVKGEKAVAQGATSNARGSFTLSAVPAGTYRLAIRFVGYAPYSVAALKLDQDLNLGTIEMSKQATELDAVVVEGAKVVRPIETNLEGMTIRPEQNISNVGGSVLDVLRNTPSVSVGQDGGLTLRGSSSTNVLINGRNSALSGDLSQIPASAIKNIDIINNPNAKYDAEGTGGVINIKLKKGGDQGTHGNVELTGGSRMRTNASARISHQKGRVSAYGGYSYRRWPSIADVDVKRETFGADGTLLLQDRAIKRDDFSHTANYGVDYYFNKSKLTYEGVFETEGEEDSEITTSERFDTGTNNRTLYNVRDNVETEDNYTLDNSLIYERVFDEEGREFRALASYSYRDGIETQNAATQSLNDNSTRSEAPADRQRASTDELRRIGVAQVDYTHPFANNNKLEAGAKMILRGLNTDFDFDNYNNGTQQWQENPAVSNRFRYQEQVYAAYAIYSQKFEKIDLSAGVRLEQTLVDTKLYNADEENQQRYLNPFPSFSAQYHLDERQSLKLTYSRRIDRPGSWQLNPFRDIADTLNVRFGNPNLQPEYIQSLEFGHKISLEKIDLTSTLFYRRTNGLVDWVVNVTDNGVSERRPENLTSGTTYGIELINTTEFTPWWNVNVSYSLFRALIDGTNLDADFTNEALAWNAKLVSNFVLPGGVDLQFTGNYESPEAEAQGFDDARYYLDASVRRNFLGEKGSVSVSVRDVFDTYQFGSDAETERFRQYFTYKRDSRMVLVTVGYKF